MFLTGIKQKDQAQEQQHELKVALWAILFALNSNNRAERGVALIHQMTALL